MNFENELAKGNFTIPFCEKCSKTVWPPSDFCSYCFAGTILKKGDFIGKIIEFSIKNDQFFGIIQFDGFKIMAGIDGKPKKDGFVKIKECGITKKGYFFKVVSIL